MSQAAILVPPGGTSYPTSQTSTGRFELVRPNAYNGGTYAINYYVKGRWK